MEFKAGDKIEAVDELGRWEAAVVKSIDSERQTVSVTFPGWSSEFDVTNPLTKIRRPVNIYSGRIGEY